MDFYEVTKLVGKSMVEIRQIGAQSEATGDMQGRCVPVPGNYIGEAVRKRVGEGNAIKTRDWGSWAYPIEPVAVVAGKPVYGASFWSSYH